MENVPKVANATLIYVRKLWGGAKWTAPVDSGLNRVRCRPSFIIGGDPPIRNFPLIALASMLLVPGIARINGVLGYSSRDQFSYLRPISGNWRAFITKWRTRYKYANFGIRGMASITNKNQPLGTTLTAVVKKVYKNRRSLLPSYILP